MANAQEGDRLQKEFPAHVQIYTEVRFKQEHVGHFPLIERLDGRPVVGGFSWGVGSPNMAEALRFGNPQQAREATNTFLTSLGMSLPPRAVCIAPGTGNRSEDDIAEITEAMIHEHEESLRATGYPPAALFIEDNFIYTKSQGLTLMVKPADCPSSIVYAKDRNGRDIVGIGHWGREELISMNPAIVIAHLRGSEGCDIRQIRIGISPGIGKDHYVIKRENVVFSENEKRQKEEQARKEDKELPKLIVLDLERWGKRAVYFEKEGEFHLDLLGRTIDMLMEAGVPPKNIEAYDVDTYAAAERGECFSQRFSTVTDQPQRNGRFIVAAQLSP